MSSIAEVALRRTYSRFQWQPVSLGLSGARVFRLDGPDTLYVKLAEVSHCPDPGLSPRAEAERLAWLAQVGVPCPEVLDSSTLDDVEYLVTRAVPGHPASDPWPVERRLDVMDALADFARELHRLPLDTCPFDRTLKVTIPQAQEAAGVGEVDTNRLDPRRRGWTVTQLVTELLAQARIVGREEPVVCHGDYCLPNLLLDPQTLQVNGIIDVGRLGKADRYVDLALAQRSIRSPQNPQFTQAHADRFLYRYGEIPLDTDRVEFYELLDEF